MDIKIKKGDTLGMIAKKHNVSIVELAKFNNISNVNRVEVGQVISLPHNTRPFDIDETKSVSRHGIPVERKSNPIVSGGHASTTDLLISPKEIQDNYDIYQMRFDKCSTGACLERANNYYNEYVAKPLGLTDSWAQNKEANIPSGPNNPRTKDYGESADSWDIHGLLQEAGGKKYYAAKSLPTKELGESPYEFGRLSEAERKRRIRDMNLPVGAIVGFGDKGTGKDKSKLSYNSKKGLVDSRHSARVVGFDDEGNPMVFDYDKVVPLYNPKFNSWDFPITNITAPKGTENLTYDELLSTGKLQDVYSPTKVRYKGTTAVDTDEFDPFLNSLSYNKKKVSDVLGISFGEYDNLQKQAAALAVEETEGGNDLVTRNGIPSYVTDKIGLGKTKGITQINASTLFNSPSTKENLSKLGITVDNYDPWNPDHQAAATVVLLHDNKYIQNKNAKTPGNAELSDIEKATYQWNSPGSLKRGSAHGDLASVQKAKTAYDNMEVEYAPSYQRVGHVVFDSNKARVQDNTLIVNDINTGKDYGVVRNQDGSYDFAKPRRNSFATGGHIQNNSMKPKHFDVGGVYIPTHQEKEIKQFKNSRVGKLLNAYQTYQNVTTGIGAAALNYFVPGAGSALAPLQSKLNDFQMGLFTNDTQQKALEQMDQSQTWDNMIEEDLPALGSFANGMPGLGKTPTKVAMGGDIPLSSNSFQVKGNPSVQDGNLYQMGSDKVALDHNEVVTKSGTGAFVFSDILKNPVTGNSFAKDASKIERSTGKTENVLRSNPNDAQAQNTIKHNKMNLATLRSHQEAIASLLGHRNPDGSTIQRAFGGFMFGGPGGPGGPGTPVTPAATTESTATAAPHVRQINYDDPALLNVKATNPYLTVGKVNWDALPKEAKSTRLRDPQTHETILVAPKRTVGITPDEHRKVTNAGTRNNDYGTDSGKSTSRSKIYEHAMGGVLKFGPGGPTGVDYETFKTWFNSQPGVKYQLTGKTWDKKSTDAYNATKEPFLKASGLNTISNYSTSASIPNYETNQFESRSIKIDPKTGVVLDTASSGLQPIQFSKTTYTPGVSATPENLSVNLDLAEYLAPAKARTMVNPVGTYSSNPTVPDGTLAPDGSSTSGNTFKNPQDWTIGDGLQVAEVASKFDGVFKNPEIEAYRTDSTPISKITFDPTSQLYQNARNFANMYNTLGANSINTQRATAMGLLANKINADEQVKSMYNTQNAQARRDYENALSQRSQYNISRTDYTNQINSQNRAALDAAKQNAYTSMGNFGEAMNNKKQNKQALTALSKLYPQIFATYAG